MPLNLNTNDIKQNFTNLSQLVSAEISASGGIISFARFMDLALYCPDWGYYMNPSAKFGKNGDFTTAPELSALFAQCIAQQFAIILESLSGQGAICELGAGTGRFAQEVLLALNAHNTLPKKYFIVETSPTLRMRQQQLLAQGCPHLLPYITWLDQLPSNFTGIIFANELLDALPVHCMRIDNNIIYERCVSCVNDNFTWALTEPTSALLAQQTQQLVELYNLPNDYNTEISLIIPHWLEKLAACLARGVLLLFDYGYNQAEYYHPSKKNGTLRCYYQHRLQDNPFILLGAQDITTNVDFTKVAASAINSGIELMGYTTQTAFLLNSGLPQLSMQQDQLYDNSIVAYQKRQALKSLLLPTEMGTLVKAIGFSKNWPHTLPAFTEFDLSHTLLTK